jgi:integrase
MALRQLPSGKWQGEYNDPHSPVKRPKQSFLTKTEAKEWVREGLVNRRKHNVRSSRPELRSIADAIEAYKSSTKFTDTRESTQSRYSDILKLFSAWCEANGHSIIQIFSHELADEYGKYLRKKYEPRTVILNMKVVSAVFAEETKRGRLGKNPFADVRRPEVEEEPPRFFTMEEIQTIFDHTYLDYQREIFSIILYCGLRTQELLNLSPKNVDHKIHIRIYERWKPKTKKSIRDIPIPDPIKPYIAHFLSVNKDKKYLISGDTRYTKGRFYQWYTKIRKRVAKARPDIDLSGTTVKTFRKTYGSILLQRGVPIAHISKLMGHSSIAVTEKIYAGLLPSNLEEGAAKLNDLKF